MKMYDSYKDSGVEWIDQIPSDWAVLKNKYFTKAAKEPSQTGEEDLLSVSEYSGVVPRKTIRIGEDHITRSDSLVGYLVVKKGQLVSNIMLMWKRGLGVSDFNGIVSPAYSVFDFTQGNPKYFHYLFRTDMYISEFRRNSTGVVESRLRLYDDSFGAIKSHFPPINTQNEIVDFLDIQITLIDSLIGNIQRKIELLKEQKLKLIEDVILNTNTKRVRLGFVADLVKRPIDRKDEVSYTKIGMLNWGRGIFKYPSELGLDLGDSTFNFLKEGDLLLSGQFSWEGSVSLVEQEHNNCISSHRFHILNGKEGEILNEYLWSYLTSQEGNFLLQENSPGSAGRNRPLNIGKLLKEKIPVPEMEFQKEIQSLVVKTNNLEIYSKQRIELLKEYRKSMISSVVTGKFKVTEDA